MRTCLNPYVTLCGRLSCVAEHEYKVPVHDCFTEDQTSLQVVVYSKFSSTALPTRQDLLSILYAGGAAVVSGDAIPLPHLAIIPLDVDPFDLQVENACPCSSFASNEIYISVLCGFTPVLM